MKRTLLFLALLLSSLGAFAQYFSAVAPSGHILYYKITNGNAEVTYDHSNNDIYFDNDNYVSGALEIPSTVSNGEFVFSVTSIGHWAFNGCSGLTSVIVPNSVTSIGGYAFENCSGLTSITIPNSVTNIEYDAFSGCSGLTSVTIPNSVTSIGSYAFSGCSGLTSVTIPNSVTSIGDHAFYYCSGLTSVTISNSVTSIEEGTFSNCSSLVHVTIPNSVTSIGNRAFYGSDGLTSVTIPNSVTQIGAEAFRCYNLLGITIPSSVTSIGYNAFYFVRILNYCGSATGSTWGALLSGTGCFYEEDDFIFRDNTKRTLLFYAGPATEVTIPNTVDSIASDAFRDRYDLTSVIIPNSVTFIGSHAFYNCSGLTSVTIGNSVTSIGTYAFYNCRGLTSVTIPSSVTSIGNYAFYDCRGLTSVTIPSSVTSISSYAFAYCSGLTSVTIPSSVTSIGEAAFSGCSGLTSMTIPNSVTYIGSSAFNNCSGLTSLTIGNSVNSIGLYVFSGCRNMDTLYYNARNLTTTSDWYYSSSSNNSYGFRQIRLNHLVIGDSVQTLPKGVFCHQDSLTSITIPNSVTSIGNYAFYNCSGLTSMTIPNSVTSIGDGAFYNCSGLTSMTIPNSVTYIGSSAFNYCSGLTSLTIGNSVNHIGISAFNNCNHVDTLYYNARDLGTVSNWYGSSSSNDSYGFRSMKLKHLVIGDRVQTLPAGVFYNQDSLSSITIPNSVTHIDYYAFYNCSHVDTLYYNARNLATRSYWYNTSSNYNSYGFRPLKIKHLVIGDSVQTLPAGVFFNQDSLTNVVIPNSVSRIDSMSFLVCRGITNLTIGNSVTRIGYGAFAFCSGLTSVTIPNSVTSINGSAFQDCSNLTSVTIPNSVTSIGNYAFYNCSNLNRVDMEGYNPPTLGSNVFLNNSSDRKIHVLCGAYDNYYNASSWSVYSSDLIEPIVDIPVTVNTDEERGNATIIPLRGQSVRCDSTVVVSATPNYGYHFDYWSTGSTLAQDTIAIEGDTVITAYFAKNQYAVNVVPNYPARGNVYGSDTIDYLDSVTISAVANYGYHFTRWDDNDTHQVRTVQVTQNKTYTAYFDYNQYQLSVVSSDTIQGLCTGSGTYNYLANRTILANANYGYHFTQWSDGNTANPRTIQLTQDTLFTAEFAKNQYVINVVSNNTDRGSVFGSDTIDYLDSITISAIANYGYHFTRWNDNDTHQVRMVQVTQNKTYTAYFDHNQYQLSVVSSDTVQGLCTGSGAYNYLSNLTIQATANYGYHFTQWSDGNTDNPRTIQLTQDTLFNAEFAKNQYSITLQSDNTSLGSVDGGGLFEYLDTATLIATTLVDHHHFVGWSDGNTENPRLHVVTEDITLTALFAIDTHHVSVTCNDPTRGMVTSTGTEFEYLSPCTVTATAYTGFIFAGWSNGVTANSYTFAVQSDVELTAMFISEAELFTVTVVSNDPTMGSVSGGGMAMSGGEVAIHAVANEGYHFVRWNDNDTNADRTVTVTANVTYTAYFESDVPPMYSITVVSDDSAMGTVSGGGSYYEGEMITISAIANEGYHFVRWNDNDTNADKTVTVTEDATYTAYFEINVPSQYSITVVSDDSAMGTVSGGGSYYEGEMITISAIANEGYHFVRWNDNDTNADRTVIVTEDATYTAYFAADQTNGIDEVEQMPTIVVRGNSIAVGNAQGQKLSIYDITGRMIVREQAVDGKQYTMPHSGVYMVQVGSHPAEKVVVVR